MKQSKILNLGGGKNPIPGSVSIDLNKKAKPDFVHDLNKFPYPFKANQFEEIYCLDVLEHLDDLYKVMAELHRISKKGARIYIKSPHYSSPNAFTDPTHRHFFSIFSFDYFTAESQWSYYLEDKFLFRTVSKKITLHKGIFCNIKEKFFNNHYKFYESQMAWKNPAEKIEVVLEVVKS